MEEHGAIWAYDINRGVMFPCIVPYMVPYISVSPSRKSRKVSECALCKIKHSADGHSSKSGAPYMHLFIRMHYVERRQPQMLRKLTYLGSVDQKKG